MQNSRLTVAKVCHEIAGHLSIIKFIEEDIKCGIQNDSVDSLFDEIDLLMYVMEFFRAMYAASTKKSDVVSHIVNIYKSRDINLEDNSHLLFNLDCGYDECIVSGILYIVSKICKKGSNVCVCGNQHSIIIKTSQSISTLNMFDALCNNDTDANLFNIFAKYIRSLMNYAKYSIAIDTLSDSNAIINLYKNARSDCISQ